MEFVCYKLKTEVNPRRGSSSGIFSTKCYFSSPDDVSYHFGDLLPSNERSKNS
jgi:hypothetical protein